MMWGLGGLEVAGFAPPADGTRDGDGVWLHGRWHLDRVHSESGDLMNNPVVGKMDSSFVRQLAAERLKEMIYELQSTVPPCPEPPVTKINQELLEACRAQHNALDILMTKLIILSYRYTPEDLFFPSKSGLPWEAMTRAIAVIQEAERLAASPIHRGDVP